MPRLAKVISLFDLLGWKGVYACFFPVYWTSTGAQLFKPKDAHWFRGNVKEYENLLAQAIMRKHQC